VPQIVEPRSGREHVRGFGARFAAPSRSGISAGIPQVRAAVTADRHMSQKALRRMIRLAALDMMTWSWPGPNCSRCAAISSTTQSLAGTTHREAFVFSGARAPF
jgi:hypothetical protein